MALVKRQSASSKTILIAVIILVVGVLGFFVFQRFFLQAGTGTVTNTGGQSGGVISGLGEETLNENKFTELHSRTVNNSVNLKTDTGQHQPCQ